MRPAGFEPAPSDGPRDSGARLLTAELSPLLKATLSSTGLVGIVWRRLQVLLAAGCPVKGYNEHALLVLACHTPRCAQGDSVPRPLRSREAPGLTWQRPRPPKTYRGRSRRTRRRTLRARSALSQDPCALASARPAKQAGEDAFGQQAAGEAAEFAGRVVACFELRRARKQSSCHTASGCQSVCLSSRLFGSQHT